MKKKIFLLLLLCNTSIILAQNIETEDAENFLEAYISPLASSVGAGLNNGWYNTAKPHNLFGFDLTLTLNFVRVPDEDLSFNPDDIDNFSTSTTSPTILGEGTGADIIYTNSNTNSSINFKMPDQTSKKNLIPIPMLNAGIGLIKETEINLRFLPKYTYDFMSFTGSVNLWGIGIKHDLMQWLPSIKKAIPIDLSVQVGHTNLNTEFNIKADEGSINTELNIQSTTLNLVASKKILMFTAYAGVGYNSSVINCVVPATFTLDSTTFTNSNNPLEIRFNSENELRSNVGLRCGITIFDIQVNHTFSKYPVTTVGVGISIN